MNNYLYEQGKEIVQNAPQLYIDLDVEADGKPGYGSLLSIGAVTPWGDEFYRELKPTSNVWVPSQRQFCEEHNLQRERLLVEGIEPQQAMHELTQWTAEQQARYKKAGSVLTAFNASFDYPWVDLEMTRATIKNPFGIAGYCIKSLALNTSKTYDWRNTSKGRLPADIVPSGDFTHHALEDAKYQQKIHFALAGKLATEKVLELEPPATMWREDALAYHIDTNDTIFVCGRCSNGRDCMDSAALYLTEEEAKTFDPVAYHISERIRDLQWDLMQRREKRS